MTKITRTGVRMAVVAALSTAAVVAGGSAVQADPPPGWSGGHEADFGSVTWVHDGWYAGARGNWHVGSLTIEEDDDVLTGFITDWRCPDGEEPPSPVVWPTPETSCKVTGSTYISQTNPWDVADFDQRRNRLTIEGDFDELDDNSEVIGSAAIDLTIKGLGAPTVGEVYSDDGTMLDYEEIFEESRAWGRVDGHRVSGPKVSQLSSSVSFYLSGLTRS